MITLASTAVPTVSTIPAMPGSVSVAPIADMMARIITTFTITAIEAKTPKSP